VAENGRKNRDEALIAALAAGGTVATAARHAGCSERTLYRRLEDRSFRARVDEARAELVTQAVGRLSAVGALAGDTLNELLTNQAPMVRLGAARAALEFMFRGHEHDTLARRLAQLKEEIEGLRHGHRGDGAGGGPAAGGLARPPGDGPPPAGPAEGGPDPDHGGGRDDAGPLAGGLTPLFG
jgi:hypothetical protein